MLAPLAASAALLRSDCLPPGAVRIHFDDAKLLYDNLGGMGPRKTDKERSIRYSNVGIRSAPRTEGPFR